MNRNRKNLFNKLGLLGSLYVSQAISLMFLVQALPVFMRQQQMSLTAIGLISLLGLPLMLNFLWSPLIDRYGFTRWGHYRFWIIVFQLLTAGATVVCAFLNLEENFAAIALCGLFMCLFFASQDIATDALTVGLLAPHERGSGNGIQLAGNYLGAIIGGGGMLIVLNRLGWTWSLLGLALAIVLALIPIWRHREAPAPSTSRQNLGVAGVTRAIVTALFQSYRRPGMGRWLLILAVFIAGGNMASAMFRPLLVDLGMSLEEIGFLLGVVGNASSLMGALFAGFWIGRWGRRRSLLWIGLIKVVAIATYLLPASGITAPWLLYLCTISVEGSIGMGYVATATVMMDRSRLDWAGTDYTAQNAVGYVSGFGAMAASGVIADAIGYQGVFAVSGAIALLSVILVAKWFQTASVVTKSA